jgi:hypothetical protein
MNVSRSEFSRRAFMLCEEDLRALWEAVNAIGPVTCTLECSDGLSREFQTLEDVLRFDNSPERSVKDLSLRVYVFKPGATSSVSMSFGLKDYSNVSIRLEGPEEVMVPLNHEIEARLAAMRPWYAIMTRGDLVLGAWFLLVVVFLALQAWVGFGANQLGAAPTADPRSSARGVIYSLGVVGVWMGLGWVLHKIRNRIFPIGSFVLGSGKARYDALEKMRWTVVIGFAVSLAGSLVAALRW